MSWSQGPRYKEVPLYHYYNYSEMCTHMQYRHYTMGTGLRQITTVTNEIDFHLRDRIKESYNTPIKTSVQESTPLKKNIPADDSLSAAPKTDHEKLNQQYSSPADYHIDCIKESHNTEKNHLNAKNKELAKIIHDLKKQLEETQMQLTANMHVKLYSTCLFQSHIPRAQAEEERPGKDAHAVSTVWKHNLQRSLHRKRTIETLILALHQRRSASYHKSWEDFIGKKSKLDAKDAKGHSSIFLCSGHFLQEDSTPKTKN